MFQVETNAVLMMETLAHYRVSGSFALHAFVVMPDHVHLLMTPSPDVSLEKAMQLIKGGFSYRLKSNFDVWERGYFEKRVPDRNAYEACVKYIHENPAKAQLEVPEEYKFSSLVRQDMIDPMPSWFAEDFRG